MILAAFGDLPEIVSIPAAVAGVAGVLATAVGVILALKLGIALIQAIMASFGVRRQKLIDADYERRLDDAYWSDDDEEFERIVRERDGK